MDWTNLCDTPAGASTPFTIDSTTKEFIFGHEDGNPGLMADGTRYYSITEATFAAYFLLHNSPASCLPFKYELLSSVSPPSLLADP